MKSIVNRLLRIEKMYSKKPLIVMAETVTGDIVTTTAQECVNNGMTFLKVLCGESVDDIDLLLEQMRNNADEC